MQKRITTVHNNLSKPVTRSSTTKMTQNRRLNSSHKMTTGKPNISYLELKSVKDEGKHEHGDSSNGMQLIILIQYSQLNKNEKEFVSRIQSVFN